MTQDTPTIPVLHHLARSGGTLISKCLGSLPGVTLLSEIHPAGSGFESTFGMPQFHPGRQASSWFGLLEPSEVKPLAPMDPAFPGLIAEIARRCRDRGSTLVLRDWSHLDYIGEPWIADPPGRSVLVDVLEDAGLSVTRACTTRHPIDQWMSSRGLDALAKLDLGRYLSGCKRFAEAASEIGFVRYEDFCRDPAPTLRDLSGRLGVAYDPSWMDRWRKYSTITGETSGGRGGRGRSAQIKPLDRRPIPPELRAAFDAHPDYAPACALLGYEL